MKKHGALCCSVHAFHWLHRPPHRFLLGLGAAVIYLLMYVYQHYIRLSDTRSVKVFAFDVSKILISQSGAWVVNLVITEMIVQAASVKVGPDTTSGIQGIGWYASVFLLDCFVGVPLGLALGKGLNRWCKYIVGPAVQDDPRYQDESVARPESSSLKTFCLQNQTYGKYGPNHGDADEDISHLHCSWWISQLATWTLCVSLSRMFSGCIGLSSFALLRNRDNPMIAIAEGISEMDMSCAKKQWIIAGAMRLVLDIGQIAVIDVCNRLAVKYRAGYNQI